QSNALPLGDPDNWLSRVLVLAISSSASLSKIRYFFFGNYRRLALMPSPYQSPKRRWFQVRVRTPLLAIVVLPPLGAWAAHWLYWIRQRKEVRDYLSPTDLGPATLAPAGLWLLGERGVSTLRVPFGDKEWLEPIFPEATVVEEYWR